MATFNFTSLIGQTIPNFNVAADTLAILDTSSNVRLTQNGANLQVTTSAGTVTIANMTLAQATTSNISGVGGQIFVGDNNTGTVFDDVGNTINPGSGANLIYGMGGADTITVGDGNNVVFGGTGLTDTTDGGDTMTIGTGANTIYGNAGNDALTLTNGTAAGNTSTVFLGLGDDSYTATAAHAGNHNITGGSGADTINVFGTTGDVTIIGGIAITDTTDGADTVTLGTGSVSAFLNAGNDNVTGGATAAGKTANLNLGLGNDTYGNATAVAGATTVTGGSGNDNITFNGAATADITIFGGNGITDTTDGNDTITLGGTFAGNATIYGNAGNDTFATIATVAGKTITIFGGLGDDAVTLSTQAGDDRYTLNMGTGNDTINANLGTSADVTITAIEATDITNVTLGGGAGRNAAALTAQVAGSTIVLVNDRGSDGTYTVGTDERITLLNQTASLTNTNFIITDGDGNASRLLVNTTTTGTTMTGSAFGDQIIGGSGNDTIVGGNTAATNNDRINAGAGDDRIQYLAAAATDLQNDTVDGGDGTDTFEVTDTNAATFAANDVAALVNVETLLLSNASHTVQGVFASGRLNTINATALAGTNTLSVTTDSGSSNNLVVNANSNSTGAITVNLSNLTGNGTVTTAGGADVITAGSGNDNISTGAADDTINIAAANFTSADTIAGGLGTGDAIALSSVSAGADAVVDADFSNVSGLETLTIFNGASNQTFTLGSAASSAGINNVNGAAENTGTENLTITATGMTTAVTITGGSGNDSLTGGGQADSIDGGAANDTIIGGAGNDTLIGGAGNDTYVMLATGGGVDQIATANWVQANDLFDFRIGGWSFAGGVTETVSAQAALGTLGNNGTLVYTANAVGNASALKVLLDADTNFDNTNIGNRVVVWEIDGTNVGVGVINNADTLDNNSVTVTQVAQITGLANQAAVDTLTGALAASNFDLF